MLNYIDGFLNIEPAFYSHFKYQLVIMYSP